MSVTASQAVHQADFGPDRWTQEAEDADPGAPCRRLNSIYTMHAILKGANVQPDGYGDLAELAMPQARPVLHLHAAAACSGFQPLTGGACAAAGVEVQGHGAGHDRLGGRPAGPGGEANNWLPHPRRRQADRGQGRVRALLPNGPRLSRMTPLAASRVSRMHAAQEPHHHAGAPLHRSVCGGEEEAG